MTFSIHYEKAGTDGYTQYALDWNWAEGRKWTVSEKEGSSRWLPLSGSGQEGSKALLDNRALSVPVFGQEEYKALLDKFGLSGLKQAPSIEKIVTMSWEHLGAMRREIEKKYGLPYKEIKSDGLGSKEMVH